MQGIEFFTNTKQICNIYLYVPKRRLGSPSFALPVRFRASQPFIYPIS